MTDTVNVIQENIILYLNILYYTRLFLFFYFNLKTDKGIKNNTIYKICQCWYC